MFAGTAIVDSLALSRATKVEAQHRNIPKVQRFGRLIHNLVVHRATEKRMRMAHHSDQRWIRDGHSPQQSLKLSGSSGEEEITMECFSHEICQRMSVAESLRRRKTTVGASGFSRDVPADGYAGEDGAGSGEGIGERSGIRRRR